jgi:hypothetical protein
VACNNRGVVGIITWILTLAEKRGSGIHENPQLNITVEATRGVGNKMSPDIISLRFGANLHLPRDTKQYPTVSHIIQ